MGGSYKGVGISHSHCYYPAGGAECHHGEDLRSYILLPALPGLEAYTASRACRPLLRD